MLNSQPVKYPRMRRILTCLLAASFSWAVVSAQDKCPAVFALDLSGIYGYNSTIPGYAGAAAAASLSLSSFAAEAYMEVLGAGSFVSSLTATPVFPLRTGELFIDGTAHFRSLYSDRVSEFVSAASFGYRMDWFSVQAGLFSRTIIDMDRKIHDNANFVPEPFNLLYKVTFHIRPSSSVWNAGGGVSNYSDYEYERMWQPLFFIDGYYRISESLNLKAEVTVKPTGMFHLVASFYGIRSSLGLSYAF